MLVRMWRKKNTPQWLVGLQACKTTLEVCLQFLRKLDIVLLEDPTIPLLDLYPEDFSTGKKDTKYSYVSIHNTRVCVYAHVTNIETSKQIHTLQLCPKC
jgi:hypothetical protein